MTVLVREELNDADLAWAASDLMVANVMAEALRVQAMLTAQTPSATPGPDGDLPAGAANPEPLLARAAAAGFR